MLRPLVEDRAAWYTTNSQKEPRLLNRHKARTLEWSKLIGITGGAQVIVQALGFLSGILIVRKLPTNEYAYYTIATAMLSTMTALADGGIGSGVISQGGKVWQDPVQLGKVMATGLALRKRFALLSALAAPVLIYLMRKHDASWLVSIAVLACLVPTFLASLSDSLLEVAPKLRQRVVPLQQNLIAAAASRAVLTVLMAFTVPLCATAVLATGISRTWANIRLRRIASEFADWHQQPDPEIRKNILDVVWRILPSSIYYCISGQVTIWVISIFGSTAAVGQLGGLTGLSQAMTLFSVLFTTLIVPRFARLPDVKALLVKRFVVVQIGLVILSFLIIFAASLFSREILWLLGRQFRGLSKELTIAFASSCAYLLSGSTSQLLSARGIVVPPLVFIPFAIAAQIGLAFVLPLHEVTGALLYGLYTALAIYVLRLTYFAFNMN